MVTQEYINSVFKSARESGFFPMETISFAESQIGQLKEKRARLTKQISLAEQQVSNFKGQHEATEYHVEMVLNTILGTISREMKAKAKQQSALDRREIDMEEEDEKGRTAGESSGYSREDLGEQQAESSSHRGGEPRKSGGEPVGTETLQEDKEKDSLEEEERETPKPRETVKPVPTTRKAKRRR